MKKAKYAYVSKFNSIGVIIDRGTDSNGEEWFRTDSDGVRYSSELLFLYTKRDVIRCAKQLNARIAPSTKKLIGI